MVGTVQSAGGIATAPNGAAPPAKDPTAWQAAEAFEAMFLYQVFDAMSAGLSTGGPFGGGPAEGSFRAMLNEKYAGAMSRAGGVGIADNIYREIIRLQEARYDGTTSDDTE